MGFGTRIESLPRSHDIEEGLTARAFDALWFLARQWQFGEFRGDDTGSPYLCSVEGTAHHATAWRAHTGDEPGPWRPYDPATSHLEALVEAEPVDDVRLAALRLEGGRRFRAPLAAAGRTEAADAVAAACPWDDAGLPAPRGVTAALRRLLPDPLALAELLSQPDLETSLEAAGVPAADRAAVVELATPWLEWWAPRADAAGVRAAEDPDIAGVHQPAPWNVHHLDHGFDLAAPTAPSPLLRAGSYRSGRVDWSEFDDTAEEITDDPGPGASSPVQTLAIPMPASFAGMPANRFWEMEDAVVDFGRADASVLDLGRLMLVQFATVYGNDWCVAPVRLPVASVTEVTDFLVADVFGGLQALGPCGAVDRSWRLFSQGGDTEEADRCFFLAPALPGSLQGPVIEHVTYLRDEMANVAWAVEDLVPDGESRAVDRLQEWFDRTASAAPSGPPGGPETPQTAPRYLVSTEVPTHWFPLVAERLSDGESIRLRLTAVARLMDGAVQTSAPLGRLLADHPVAPAHPDERLWLYEEDVPRTGVQVTRAAQLARSHDGGTRTWVGRSVSAGVGEASSGLRHDVLAEPDQEGD
ncbi:hypothetical protein ACIQ6Y_32870 [Streptomyces sp. NPDC096205]|uniref:hypothetical protein n=1 Tax=Streptomyces sp. NPDC096205 TaxID=3366081 RepID=UPI00380CF63F